MRREFCPPDARSVPAVFGACDDSQWLESGGFSWKSVPPRRYWTLVLQHVVSLGIWKRCVRDYGQLAVLRRILFGWVYLDAIHVICDGAPAIGASGAINGVVGFYLILFPTNKVDCFYWFWFRAGTVEVTGYWLVILWFLGDVLGAWLGDAGVAYWAHLGGLGAGIAAGVLYETRGWATLADYDNPSLITLIFRRKGPEVKKSYKTREELIREHFAQQPPSAEVPVEKPPDVFTVACPHCNQMLELRADMIGQTIQCPDCSGEMNVEE